MHLQEVARLYSAKLCDLNVKLAELVIRLRWHSQRNCQQQANCPASGNSAPVCDSIQGLIPRMLAGSANGLLMSAGHGPAQLQVTLHQSRFDVMGGY